MVNDYIDDAILNGKDGEILEWLLFDRIEKIKSINEQYDLENNAYLSFSGGKDSTILHYLIDLALPGNKIPRVFINTGIEYNYIIDFVKELASRDKRFVIIKPSQPIKPMLEEYGYPFKSKEHSKKLSEFKRGSRAASVMKYKDNAGKDFGCPLILKYQFEDDFTLKISDKCCTYLKKKPASKWAKENGKTIILTGMRKEEGGQRKNIKGCVLTDKKGKLKKFHPLLVVNKEFVDWFIQEHNIKLCKLYYPPFNFERTGCKGCPFNLKLKEQLKTMEKLLPNEAKQCKTIFGPVYQEYRKRGYRLDKQNWEQLSIYDFLNNEDAI